MKMESVDVLIIGAGISGEAAAKIVIRQGGKAILSDAKDEDKLKGDLEPLRQMGCELVLGLAKQTAELLKGIDLVIHALYLRANDRLAERERQQLTVGI